MSGLRIVPVEKTLVRVRLFGALEARSVLDVNVLPRSQKARAILAYLLLCPDDVVPRRRFGPLLWSKRWPEQQQTSARKAVSELKAALMKVSPRVIAVQRDTIRLQRSAIWIDGLSRRADNRTEESSTIDVATFLETLVGVDAPFDAWIAEMRTELMATKASLSGATPSTAGQSLHSGIRAPRLDIMPFVAFGEDSSNSHMAPALAHELATGLSRFRWVAVRMGNASFGNAGGADYRIEGHIAHSPAGGRLTVRLIDAESNAIVWPYATDIETPLRPAAIASLAEKVVERLDPEILAIETRRVLASPVVPEQAYDLMLRALPSLYSFQKSGFDEAYVLLERARTIAPNFGRAQAFSALLRLIGLAQGWLRVTPQLVTEIDTLTTAALTNDPTDSLGTGLAGHIRVYLHRDFKGAKELFARALELNPNCGFSWGYSAMTYAYLGRTREARERLTRARRTMIHEPLGAVFRSFETVILYFERNWLGLIETARAELARLPGFTNIRKLLVVALCMVDDDDEAHREHRIILETEPGFDWARHVAGYPFAHEEDREAMRLALVRAGFLEGNPSNLNRSTEALQPLRRATSVPTEN